MQIGIGVPNSVPGATGNGMLDWARRADKAGFSSLGSIGAVVLFVLVKRLYVREALHTSTPMPGQRRPPIFSPGTR